MAQVVVQPDTGVVAVDGTLQFVATLWDSAGERLTGRGVIWGSSSTAIATIDRGLVTGRGIGSATITAVSEGQAGTATVMVEGASGSLAGVQLVPGTASVKVGHTVQLDATVRDGLGNPLPSARVTWGTTDSKVASVADDGTVTGNAVGTVLITATSGGQSASSTVTVAPFTAGYPNEPAGAIATPGSPFVADFASHFYLNSGYPGPVGTAGGGFHKAYVESDTQPFGAVYTGNDNLGQQILITVSDPTAPVNPSTVGAVRWNNWVNRCEDGVGGIGVGALKSYSKMVPPGNGTVKEWYTSFHFKLSSNFTYANAAGGVNSGLKFINFWQGDNTTLILIGYPETVAGPRWQFRWWRPAEGHQTGFHSGNGFVMARGTWYHVETLIDYQTGVVRTWINGAPYQTVTFPSMAGRAPAAFHFDHVNGGGDLACQYGTDGTYFYHDEIYTSYTLK